MRHVASFLFFLFRQKKLIIYKFYEGSKNKMLFVFV